MAEICENLGLGRKIRRRIVECGFASNILFIKIKFKTLSEQALRKHNKNVEFGSDITPRLIYLYTLTLPRNEIIKIINK